MTEASRWLRAFLEERNGSVKPSMARLVALCCGLAGCAVAVIGAVTKDEQAATVAALIGGGAVSLLARKKNESPNGAAGKPSDGNSP